MTSAEIELAGLSLGEVLKRERGRAGLSIRALAKQSGISLGQLSKLENDQVAKVNPAHLAVLAASLDVPLHRLYAAAGYDSPETLQALEPELVARLAELPSESLDRIAQFLDELIRDGRATWDGPLLLTETAPVDAAEQPTDE